MTDTPSGLGAELKASGKWMNSNRERREEELKLG